MKGFIFAVIATVIGFVVVNNMLDERAMEQCQKHYSFDTCFYSLHR